MKSHLSLVAILVIALPAIAQPKAKQLFPKELSADMVITHQDGTSQKGRLHFGKDKMRFEMSADGRTMVMIQDIGARKAWMLMPEQRAAMELSAAMAAAMKKQGAAQTGTEELVSGPDGNPCGNAAAGEGRTCTRLGAEKINGRQTDKWRMVDGSGRTSLHWVDRTLRISIRYEQGGIRTELRNIQEGPQKAELFEVPKGYRVMQMPGAPGGAPPPTDASDED